MSISSVFFTNKGKILQAKAQTGTPLHFTRIALGDGELQGQAPQTFNTLVNEKLSIDIIKLVVSEDGTAKVGGGFNNSSLTTGFYYRELGLFAQDPDNIDQEILYCYGNAGALAGYIPAQGSELIEKKIDIIAIIGNATKVSATINSSLIGLGPEDLELHDKSSESHQPIRQLIQTEENARIQGDSQLDAKIKNLESKVQNIDVSGDVRQVINERVNTDISKPLSTLISEWANAAKTAILNGINGLPQKSVWSDERGAKLDNLNQSMTVTQNNINSTVNSARDNVKEQINWSNDNIKSHISNTVNKARSRMYKPTWNGEVTSDLLNITSPKGGRVHLGGNFYDSGYISVWVDGVQIVNNENPGDLWSVNFNNKSGYSPVEFCYTSSIRIQHIGRQYFSKSGTARIIVHENI